MLLRRSPFDPEFGTLPVARRLVTNQPDSAIQVKGKAMKTLFSALLLTGLLIVASGSANADPYASVGIDFGAFYSSLSPYGEWVSLDDGAYAWRPVNVERGWRPYWAGRWLWTDDGWYWDSEEPWAWATYHYGRWYYDDYYGWLWIPGYDWAPAWVDWRFGGDFVGWAPLGPYAVFHVGFGIRYSRPWVTPYHYWSFVDCRYLGYPNVHHHIYRTDHNTRFIGRTRSAGNIWVDSGRIGSRGPDRDFVERRGGVRIGHAEINDVGSRDQVRVFRNGDRERIDVYRPRIDASRRDNVMERPANVRDRERVPSLDMRGTDVQRRAESRESDRDEPVRPEAPRGFRSQQYSAPNARTDEGSRNADRTQEFRQNEGRRVRNNESQGQVRGREFNADRARSFEQRSNRSSMPSTRIERSAPSIQRDSSPGRSGGRNETPRSAPSSRGGGERRGR
jgi:hypothetical protein